MSVSLYNTLTRKTETFEPRNPGVATVYCCGPTVYDVPHAGHARSAVAFDVLVRVLRARGLEVTHVRNITDIDDKILNRSRELGETPQALARRMADIYRRDLAAINCMTPTHEPCVTDHIDQIVEIITDLMNGGAAYAVDKPGDKRDVYFSVRSFPGYGKLSRRKLDELVSGARVEADETKRDPLDFALWKGVSPSEWGWDSPWGRGRPGWHIECSAMSGCYLGHGFDIHGGGMDLIFPHHENEIAQSEAAHPGEGSFARFWLHNGFVNIDKEKMSKSLGNFVTVRDVLARNDGEGFRWFLLGVHYRGPIQFDTDKIGDRVVFPGVDEAERRVDYLYTTLERLSELAAGPSRSAGPAPAELRRARSAVEAAVAAAGEALSDDLNTPVALAELGEVARHANEVADLAAKRKKDPSWGPAAAEFAVVALGGARRIADQLGVLQTAPAEYRARTRGRRLSIRGLSEVQVAAKIRERAEARAAKDFTRSDALRDELARWGIEVHDSAQGTAWTIDV